MTYRRLKVLLDALPPDSATNTAVREQFTDAQLAEMAQRDGDGGYGPWSRVDYWFASISDRIDQLIYALVRVNGGKPDPPKPLPRPGLVAPSDYAPPDPALVALLEQRRAERRAAQETRQDLACGCPDVVLETGRHLTSCTVLYPHQLPEEGGTT